MAELTVTERIDQQHQEDLRRLKSLRLLDDDFLTKCFEGDPKYIQLVLRIVLEMPDLVVVDVRTQVFVENLLKRSDKGAGRKRARYNSSMMDANLLQKGEDFKELPETYVIFITEHDVIGKGRPLYHVGRYIFDTNESFEDGSHILYVNGAYRGETPIGRLMHDFSCTDPADMYYEELAERVRFFKEEKEGISIMCKVMEDMRNESLKEGVAIGEKRGMEKGAKENMKETALRMLLAGNYALEEISNISGLSVDDVKRLQIEQGV